MSFVHAIAWTSSARLCVMEECSLPVHDVLGLIYGNLSCKFPSKIAPAGNVLVYMYWTS